jgi:hypothetical protein
MGNADKRALGRVEAGPTSVVVRPGRNDPQGGRRALAVARVEGAWVRSARSPV